MDEKELETTVTEEVAEEITEAAAEESTEETADQASVEIVEEAAGQDVPETGKKKKCRRSLFLKRDTLEWMSTLALAVIILFAGYLLGLASQAGYSGVNMVKAAFGDWYNILYVVVLAATALLCSTVCKKHDPAWVAIPVGVYACMTCFAMYRPIAIAYALLYTYSQNPGDANALMLLQQMMVPLCLVLGTYLFQLLACVSFVLLVSGKGNRWVHLVLSFVWLVGNVLSNFPNVSASINDNAPLLMLNLSFVIIAALYALPAICGKKVPACELAGLQAADAAARKAKPETIAVIADTETAEPCEECCETAEEAAAESCEAVEEAAVECCETAAQVTAETAEEAAETDAAATEEN